MLKKQKIEELKKYRYAHRGLHSKPEIPENSLAAFSRAADKGFGIEFDVHLTLDKKLAVIHDSSLKRVTTMRADGRAVIPENIDIPSDEIFLTEDKIEEISLSEAKRYPLEESDERIPELREVLELINGRVPLIIELKPTAENFRELTDLVIEELAAYDGLYAVESFNFFAVNYLRKAHPDIIRGQLATDLLKDAEEIKDGDPRERVEVSKSVNYVLRELIFNIFSRPDFVAYKFEHRRNIRFREFKGMKVHWTIKNTLDLEIAERSGATCIFERFIPEDNSFGGKI